METKAEITRDKVQDGFATTPFRLTLTAKITGADQAKFAELAAKAKAGCPVSKLLNAEITFGCGAGVLTRTSRARSDSQ
jgi:osmotically inducible protein OsmC